MEEISDEILRRIADRFRYEAAFSGPLILPGFSQPVKLPESSPVAGAAKRPAAPEESVRPPVTQTRIPTPIPIPLPVPDSDDNAGPIIRVTRQASLLDMGETGPDGLPLVSTKDGPKPERLQELETWALKCTRCGLCRTRTQVVFGVGAPDARLMFVGEAPGADEDAQGEPFVGRSGRKLTEIIRAMGLTREDVYICNILKCRPPDNREPTPIETQTCTPILEQQIATIEPEVIVTLGRPATCYLLQTNEGIGRLRGRFHDYDGIPLMPTFHPAYLLRAYTPENRRKVWSDMQKVMQRLGLSGTANQ